MSTQLGGRTGARSTGDTAVLLGTSSAVPDFGVCSQEWQGEVAGNNRPMAHLKTSFFVVFFISQIILWI